MGDRSSATFTVLTCPDQVAANRVIAIAEEYGFGHEWEERWNSASDLDLILGEQFTNHELSLGDDSYIARALLEAGVVAEVEQDAKYEYPAEHHLVVPGLGVFSASGTNDEPAVAFSQIDKLIEETTTRQELVDALERHTGAVFRRAVSEAWKAVPDEGEPPIVWKYDEDVDVEEFTAKCRYCDVSIRMDEIEGFASLEPIRIWVGAGGRRNCDNNRYKGHAPVHPAEVNA